MKKGDTTKNKNKRHEIVILNSLRQHYIYKEQNKGFSENLKNIAAKFLICLL
jgi:hypothetical protein